MLDLDIGRLNELYRKSDEVDREVFAEMRSNILLVSGEHYARQGGKEADPRTSRQSEKPESRLRLTKNHCHRLSHTYTNALLAEDPGIAIEPQVDTDMQDRKDAELNTAVWKYIAEENDFTLKKADWAKDFVDIGEVCVKVFWDYSAGRFTGKYEPLVQSGKPVMEETGEFEEMLDETGMPIMVAKTAPVDDKSKPIFTGGFVWEEVLPFNLLRDPDAKTMGDRNSPWIVRKMVSTLELKRRYAGDEAILQKLNDSQDEEYIVFDAAKQGYDRAKDHTMVREYYWRPRAEEGMERGYFIFATKDVILAKGPLPKGIWPFAWAPFNRFQSTPRGRSILKVARPYQIEVNRASSKIAEAQITLGDDKLITSAGSKITPGASFPGVRSVAVSGVPPTILPGRDGSQYMPYVAGQIVEFDQVTLINEMNLKAEGSQMDPYLLMYQSAAKKRAHKIYNMKFDAFLVDVAKITLELAQEFLPDDVLIPAIGQREIVNIEEFRKTSPLSHKVNVSPGAETLEDQFGRQLIFQHMLQYVGKDLDQGTIAKMAKNLPYGNLKDSLDKLTLDEDIATNTMLALERGKRVGVHEYIDPMFMLQNLTRKVSSPEFEFFAPEIQAGYKTLIAEYQQIKMEQEQAILDAKNEFIPRDGALVPVDMYITDPSDPSKSKRARLPHASLEWLMRTLEAQGASLESLESSNTQNLSEMANLLMGSKQQGDPAEAGYPPQLVR